MSFKVFLHPKPARFLSKLEKGAKERMKSKLSEPENYPERRGERLKHSNFRTLRIGDFRAIYEIDRENDQVIVLFIGHRKDVYDDFSKLF